MKTLAILLIACVVCVQVSYISCRTDDEQLNQKIRLVYSLGPNPRSRHLVPSSQQVIVSFGLKAFEVELTDVNDFTAVAHLRAWRAMSWTDPTLQWNSANFGGIGSVNLLTSSIWIPDIENKRNIHASDEVESGADAQVFVLSSGTVYYSADSVERVRCNRAASRTGLAFDCQLVFGSLYQGLSTLDLIFTSNSSRLDLANFRPGRYSITNDRAARVLQPFYCCPNVMFPTIVYNFTVVENVAGK